MMEKSNFSEIIFIDAIKQLHGFIGNTILKLNYSQSGIFCDEQIMRWKPSSITDLYTYFILSGTTHSSIKMQDPVQLLIKLFADKLDITKAETLKFIEILNRLKNDDSIKIRESQKLYMSQNHVAVVTKEKLCAAYLENKLSLTERQLVNRIVTIGIDPANIPTAMSAFGKTIITN